eukprot:1138913-Pelagomonas_calceolata.AAC.1
MQSARCATYMSRSPPSVGNSGHPSKSDNRTYNGKTGRHYGKQDRKSCKTYKGKTGRHYGKQEGKSCKTCKGKNL